MCRWRRRARTCCRNGDCKSNLKGKVIIRIFERKRAFVVFCFLISSFFFFREFHRGDPGEETEIRACHIPLFRCFYSPLPPYAFGFLSFASLALHYTLLLCFVCSVLALASPAPSHKKRRLIAAAAVRVPSSLPSLPPSLPPSILPNDKPLLILLSSAVLPLTLSLSLWLLALQPICTLHSASIPPPPPSLTHTYLNNPPPSLPPSLSRPPPA